MNDTPDLFGPPDPGTTTTLRLAGNHDRKALERLADLDQRDDVGESPHVVAEEDGEIVAALSLSDGTALCHPFRATAHAIALLRLRVAQLAW